MSFFLAFAAFSALVILHEFGHFIAAKAVGMRVERFSLFFPPALFKVRRGETSYEVGALPLGGFVKITGMNPDEDVPPEVAHRAYCRQPVWKRIVTIAAGPLMNVLIAFVLVFVLFAFVGISQVGTAVEQVDSNSPAAEVLRPGDRIVQIGGVTGTASEMALHLDEAAQCSGPRKDGCAAAEPVSVTVMRDGQRRSFEITPRFDAEAKRMRLGVAFGLEQVTQAPLPALESTVSGIWRVTKLTFTLPARVFDPQKRKEISSVVGGYERTRVAIKDSTELAIQIVALISLSLAVINLFPFLPLDGGHIFWALAEKVSGRPIPMRVLERASVVGLVLIAALFAVGLSNDIDRFRNGGFGP